MDEIIRRLRQNRSKAMKSLKESLPVRALKEDEETPEEEEEVTIPDPDSNDTADAPEEAPAEDTDAGEEGEEETDSPDEEPPKEEEPEHTNPLDNMYAVKYELGQEVVLTYANGNQSKISGTIEGYDTEGFYRVKWSNGKISNGLTDLLLSEKIDSGVYVTECVCGCNKFITENSKKICDSCGRVATKRGKKKVTESSMKSPKKSVRESKDIDSMMDAVGGPDDIEEILRDYLETHSYPEEDIAEYAEEIADNTYINAEDELTEEEWYNVVEYILVTRIQESSDPLTIADKKRPAGKKLIRSEAHPMSTAAKPSIAESIRSAFKRKSMREGVDDANSFEDLLKELQKIKNYHQYVEALKGLNADQKKLFMAGFGQVDMKKPSVQDSVGIDVKVLAPTQSEIDWVKSLSYGLKQDCSYFFKSPVTVGYPVLTYNGKYIIDGHHRWSQVYMFNPEAKVTCTNFRYDQSGPVDVLRDFQAAVLAQTGNVAVGKAGTNIWSVSEAGLRDYIDKEMEDVCWNSLVNVGVAKDRESAIDYIVGNALLLQRNNRPASGAPDRVDMPQTNPAVIARAAHAISDMSESNNPSADVFKDLHSLENEFWTKQSEMIADITDLGYEVDEANGEYVIIFKEDEEGNEHQMKIPMGGTSRTLTLDFKRATEL